MLEKGFLRYRQRFFSQASDHSNIKVLTPEKMLQRLLVALAREKAGNTSKSLPNEIIPITYNELTI